MAKINFHFLPFIQKNLELRIILFLFYELQGVQFCPVGVFIFLRKKVILGS